MAFVTNSINFPNLSAKSTPIGADIIMLADSAAANALKQATFNTLMPAVMPTSETTGTSDTLIVNRVYIANNGGLVTYTLPASAALGDWIVILGKGAGGWKIAQNANQAIHLGNVVTTTGTAGSLASTNQWDNISIRCITAGSSTIWTALPPEGTITYV